MDLEFRTRLSTTMVILHGGHTEHNQPNLKDWLLVNGRRLGLLQIGYHYIIFTDGGILCTRPHDKVGAHTPGHNKEAIGVYLAGGLRFRDGPDGEQIAVQCDNFTPAQWKTLGFLYAELRGYYSGLELKAHSELDRKPRLHMCPPVDMDKVRDLCLKTTSGKPTDPGKTSPL